ncbi:ZIP family metal transporter [Effusibacillus pohliae]|uniref:ZIP family metal transporter n=1 Tax=Effusibacillus pohliae TaxID=232270 RepID=UPI00037F8618|nr:ZIP family metal transporter [Effusibacillus pohliae]
MWEIVCSSFLSGMATPVGGWLVLRFRRLSKRLLAVFLGLATGIMLTVVLTELMPASIASGGHAMFLVGAGSGWFFLLLLRGVVSSAMKRWGLHGEKAAFLQMGWFLALSIALHDLPEGFAIGAGESLHPQVGMVIALAIALHNIPEGMSIAVPLRLAGVGGWQVIWITFLAGMTTPLGTVISLWLFTVSDVFISLSLAFAGGAMVYVVSRDILPEALQANKLWAALGIAIGAGVMLAVSALH